MGFCVEGRGAGVGDVGVRVMTAPVGCASGKAMMGVVTGAVLVSGMAGIALVAVSVLVELRLGAATGWGTAGCA